MSQTSKQKNGVCVYERNKSLSHRHAARLQMAVQVQKVMLTSLQKSYQPGMFSISTSLCKLTTTQVCYYIEFV